MAERKKIEEPEQREAALYNKHRPRLLSEVLGQDAVIESLRLALKAKSRQHVFCFTGPSGTGKTTLSRILAREFECGSNIIEVDAASHSGADEMRELVSGATYRGFGDSPNKAYIIDEIHNLSKKAWDVLLKPLEDAPEHVFYFLCTSEAPKLPATIETRCQTYNLKAVDRPTLTDLVERVLDEEDAEILDAAIPMVVQAAQGSPRRALVLLAKVIGLTKKEQVKEVLDAPDAPKELIDLCRVIVDGRNPPTWAELVKTLQAIPETSAEGVRIMVSNYLAACLMRAKGDKEAMRLLNLLASFSKPYASTDKLAPLLLSFGDVIFG